MQVLNRSKVFDETSGQNAAKIFPYLGDRLDAVKEIRDMEADLIAATSLTKRLARQGRIGRRIGSVPYHIMQEMALYYGNKHWWANPKLLKNFLRENPEWATVERNQI